MRALLQRVKGAKVSVAGEILGEFTGSGIVVFLGVTHSDTSAQAEQIVRKLTRLQVIEQEDGREQSILEADAPVLLISQFTLYASVKKGKKPSWSNAAKADRAEPLYEEVAERLRASGAQVYTGKFGADMQVELCNDGPYTLWIEAENPQL